jgi:ribosomal protein L11 methyltransferase
MDYIELSAKIEPLEIGRDILIAELSEIGFESFVETDDGVDAFIQLDLFNEDEVKGLEFLKSSEFEITYIIKLIEAQNWNKTWEESFDPINVENQCSIRAPFHEKVEGIKYDIIINPKMSFGTGHHETTYLMVKKLLSIDVENKSVLDMGCGTGVLAILAKMKKSSKVVAIDIDEWAYNNTLENIGNNNCGDIIVQQGGAELLGSMNYDLILANINRNILLRDMSKYVDVLVGNGILLLSGFYSSDEEKIMEEATRIGLKKVDAEMKNDWMMLHLIKA